MKKNKSKLTEQNQITKVAAAAVVQTTLTLSEEKESLLSRSCCRHSRSNQLGICGKEAAAEDQLITLQGERERIYERQS